MTEAASNQRIPGDHFLRRDIRLLGWKFRRLIQSHCGKEIWNQLHHLREWAERRQRGDEAAEAAIVDLLNDLSVDRLAVFARAMGMFFDLANLAEDRHRVRVLRQREAKGRASETIQEGIEQLRAGTTPSEFHALLANLEIEPVFTAHPTEAKRRTIRRILRRLRRDLYQIDRRDQLRSERRRRLAQMNRDMLALWSTASFSTRKPTVMEELERTIFVVRTLWRVGPHIMDKIRSALQGEVEINAIDRPLRFGNWVGGDRDGNPFVTCDVTRDALTHLRRTAIRLHRRTCREVRRRLTTSASRCPLPATVKQAIDQAQNRWPQLTPLVEPLHPQEWLVQWLTIIDERLRVSARLHDDRKHPMAYRNATELADDLNLIRTALIAAGHDELTSGALLRWQDRVRIFGLYLLRLDIRINSKGVRSAVTQLLAAGGVEVDYLAMDDAERTRVLADADVQAMAASPTTGLDADTRDLMDVLVLAQQQAAHGDRDAIGQFIVSMTHVPSDILALQWLMRVAARRAGLDKSAPLPIVPLFETIDDLTGADRLLEQLLTNDGFRRHVADAGNRLTCMVGYSDSAKDGGYFASNWALHEAQRNLVRCADRHGVSLIMFHGRGGAIGRGGGPAARAITSLPRETVDGRLRLTEQGEVIAERYDDPAIAQRHLEQLLWATLWQSRPHDNTTPSDADSIAQTLAVASMDAYRRLLHMPGFDCYLQECTALSLIEKLPIGSRPSRRTAAARLEDLRAIPYTFAWNQVRMPINAFFGLGTAFDGLDDAKRDRAVEMYKRWPWFRAVIDNAELALARCDTAITRRYAARGRDREQAAAIWHTLDDEYHASLRAVLAIKQEDTIIEAVPWLHRTIQIRNPYLDILNLIQLILMSQRKAGSQGGEDSAVDEALRLTVQAIAAGLRNTG